MKRSVPVFAVIFAPAAAPGLAQTAPGSLGGNEVGTGALVVPNPGASGSAITTNPVPSAATPSTPASGPALSTAPGGTTSTTTTASAGRGSGGGGSGGLEALCLSASGTVTSVDPDEFGLDCPQ